MAKPSITTRATKGSALSWTEGDTNLENLRDATITLKAGTGGTDVVSDLNGTVTLVAGTNVTLTGDNTAKTVTIAASGGGATTLDGLSDVTISGVANNHIIKYNSGTSQWENSLLDSAPTTLDGLSDVTISGVANNHIIKYNGSTFQWENSLLSAGATTLNELTDVNTAGVANNHILKYNSTASEWQSVLLDSGATTLDGLSDVTISGVANNHIIKYNSSTMQWENSLLSAGAANLDELSDVVITTPSSNQVLRYSGTQWENQTLTTISSVSADSTPMLGGDLNVNGKSIVSLSNGNIIISPNGTGIIRADKSIQVQAQGELRLADSDSSNYVGFKSPATVSTNKVWTLPSVDGTDGQVLSTNGSGTLAWATAGGGGTPVAILAGTISYQEFTNLQSTAISETTLPHTWTEKSDTSGMVTVSTNTITITSAGTYLLEYTSNFHGYWYSSSAGANSTTLPELTFKLYNSSDATTLGLTRIGNNRTTSASGITYEQKESPVTLSAVVTITGSKSFTVRYSSSPAGSFTALKYVYTYSPNTPVMKITKLS